MDLEAFYRRSPAPLQTAFLNAFSMKVWLHRYGPRYRQQVRELQAHDDWSVTQRDTYQTARLRSVVQYAYDHSDYYKDVMGSNGLKPADLRSPGDLVALPLLTKETLREELPRILTASAPQRGWLHGHTSGTTGSPLSLWYDRDLAVMNNAVDRRQKIWGGMRGGDWIGLVLGRVVVSPERTRPPFWKSNFVLRQVWFSAFHLHPDNIPSYVAEIRRRGLRFLEGYPSTLFILAKNILKAGQPLPMQAVFTSSETLHDQQREVIEAAFGCPIFDFYGHAERAIFACECEQHEGKHLAEEYGITEVVDADGDPVNAGELGYLVGTSLHNRAMPMLRYRTGDLSRFIEEPCPCGRTARRIASVSTKAEDIVVTPDGRFLSPSVLTHPFKPFVAISKSQVIQEAPDLVRIKLVVTDGWTPDQERELVAALRQRMGSGVAVDVVCVDEIPREASGKFRWVISKVDHSQHVSWEGG